MGDMKRFVFSVTMQTCTKHTELVLELFNFKLYLTFDTYFVQPVICFPFVSFDYTFPTLFNILIRFIMYRQHAILS